jgi:hypothetical protein
MEPRVPLLLAAASLFVSSQALAQGDLHLGWNNCRADGGVENVSFACGSNTGVEVLVASFILPYDMPQVIAFDATLYVIGEPTYDNCDGPGCPPQGAYDVPPWWQFQTGGCRSTSLSVSTDFQGEPFASSTHCLDFWNSQALSGRDYQYPYPSTRSARLRMVAAIPEAQAVALVAGQEYYAFLLRINHTKTVGTGACDGCCTPMTILFNNAAVYQPAGVGDQPLTPSGYGFFATWQNPSSCPTPTRNRTWGQVKTLYR